MAIELSFSHISHLSSAGLNKLYTDVQLHAAMEHSFLLPMIPGWYCDFVRAFCYVSDGRALILVLFYYLYKFFY